MMRRNLLVSIFLALVWGCTTPQKTIIWEGVKLKIIDVKEFKRAYLFKALQVGNDSAFIVSLKKEYLSEHGLQEPKKFNRESIIELNHYYDINVTRIKPSVSNMQGLGAFIVIGTDTLFKASNYKSIPVIYRANNILGLTIYN